MNIIELFEKLNLKKEKTTSFSSDEIIRIEKQINVEKRINPLIESNVATNLIEALKTQSEAFFFFTNHRVLYNFFAKTNYSRDQFQANETNLDNDDLRSFIQLYLEDDLSLFFDQKLTQNKFDEMNDLLLYKAYFPEDVLYKISKKAIVKIDFAIARLSQQRDDLEAIKYIKQRSFYDFMSHFSSIEIDEKLKSILNLVVQIYNTNRQSDFASSTMISMCNYTAFEDDLTEIIKKNRDVVYFNQSSSSNSRSSSGSGFSAGTIFIIIIALIRVMLMANRCSSSSDSYNNNTIHNFENTIPNNSPIYIDQYYINTYHKLDSFHNYLTDYNQYKVRNLHFNDTIKTGDNPFQNLYNSYAKTGSNNVIKFHNNSDYDVILFENHVVYDSINIPFEAVFIKSKSVLEFNTLTNTNRVFRFYVGKRLASFHGDNEKLFVRNNSVEEPRFTELASNSKLLLTNEYQLSQDVFIKNQQKNISILSENLQIRNAKSEAIQTNQSTKEIQEELPKVIEIEENKHK